jgi:UDP-N-acetylmuramate--alanine ligase
MIVEYFSSFSLATIMYTKPAHIHFIGIGGIGMSSIATILHHQGYTVSGCDQDMHQTSIANLASLGCAVYEGNNSPQCADTSIDVVVYSSAIKSGSPEIASAQKQGIPTIPRALMLAELMRTKYSIAIAGAHGKTTTTSLIGHILLAAQYDPTIIVGGHLKNLSSHTYASAHFGRGDFLVAEADESDRSFLYLHPTLAIITSISPEHLDTYANLQDIKQAFAQFINNIPFYGKAIVCIDDENIRALLPITHVKIISYGTTPDADVYARNIILLPTATTFDVYAKDNGFMCQISLAVPGYHNVLNALGSFALGRELGVPANTIVQALSSFSGVDRRFTYRGLFRGAAVFDDYAHHPKEIMHSLMVAKNYKKKRLIVLFQPHRYSRTQALWEEFLNVFLDNPPDYLIITDIFPASEEPIHAITSDRLVAALAARNPRLAVEYVPYDTKFTHLYKAAAPRVQPDDLILLLGAGKIYKMIDVLVR